MVIIFVEDVCMYVETNSFMGKLTVPRFSDTELTCGHQRTKNGEHISFPGS